MFATSKSATAAYARKIQGTLANAVAALHAADKKLGDVIAHYDDVSNRDDYVNCHPYVDWQDIMQARLNARLFANLIGDRGESPLLPARIFRAIKNSVNVDSRNLPHIEGAVLALRLAERSLETALSMACQLDSDEVDEAYEVPYAALGTIRSYTSLLACVAIIYDREAALDEILDGVPHARGRSLAMAA